jgi:hypothetical protein
MRINNKDSKCLRSVVSSDSVALLLSLVIKLLTALLNICSVFEHIVQPVRIIATDVTSIIKVKSFAIDI